METRTSPDDLPGCAGCPHLIARSENHVLYGSPSERVSFLESSGPDVEPVLRFFCSHEPSVAASGSAGIPTRQEFSVDTVDGVDHATASWNVALLAEHPGAVSDVEVPRPVRPRWCLRES